MRLLLVRHGESVCGVNGIVGGERGCTGLTERGFAQARALRDRFVHEGFRADALLASTLPRAHQTADVIAEALRIDVERTPELVEFIPGEIDGTRWEDWTDRFDVAAEPDRPFSPGGESLSAFKRRVCSVLDRFASQNSGKTVVAVCHGGIIGASLYQNFGVADGTLAVDIHHTSITEWHLRDERWHMVRFNDVAHLLGSELLAPL